MPGPWRGYVARNMLRQAATTTLLLLVAICVCAMHRPAAAAPPPRPAPPAAAATTPATATAAGPVGGSAQEVLIGATALAAAAAASAAALITAEGLNGGNSAPARAEQLKGLYRGQLVDSANLLLEDAQLPTGHIVNLTRHYDGDVFHTNGVANCNMDTCVGLSSGTAAIIEAGTDKADSLHHASLAGGGNNGQLELLTRRKKPPASAAAGGAKEGNGESCQCRCLPYLSTYREDLGICVDDIHECTLSPFVSGSSSEKIPYVFLPLRTQIIYPSREISFPDIRTPVCAVTGAQYLTTNGWSELRNPIDNDYPFRMFRDEGRTFLQWLGEPDLRQKMKGRLIVVHLVCRDMTVLLNATAAKEAGKAQKNVFSPCVAFRVNGSPVKYSYNVSEVSFQAETTSTLAATSDGMTTKEYVVIGVCSLLLGLIYVSSVFLYLHMKKRKRGDQHHMRNSLDDLANEINYPKNDQVTFGAPFNRSGSLYSATSMGTSNEPRSRASIGSMKEEMGIIKNNPLLQHYPQLGEHHSGFASDISNSNSECEMDGGGGSFHDKLKQLQTSALVHPQFNGMGGGSGGSNGNNSPKGSGGNGNGNGNGNSDEEPNEPSTSPTQENECLPQENVSIVEDMMTEEKLENLRAMVNGNVRKKLYFNPAYFEPHLLAQPPPAAVEFLQKIREVIAIAKYKMATKRFQPSLIMIPEEAALRSDSASLYSSQLQASAECNGCVNNRCSGHVKNCGDKRNSIEKWLQSVPIKDERKDATQRMGQASALGAIQEADTSPDASRKSSNAHLPPAGNRCSPHRERTPPKQRPPPPPSPSGKKRNANSQQCGSSGVVELAGQQAIYAKGGRNAIAASSSRPNSTTASRHYEAFSALSAAANIYGFAETGGEIYNNPKFSLHDSPNASQRSHGSNRSRKRLDVLDHYAAASTPTSLTSAERQHYEMLRNMKQTPEMLLCDSNDGNGTLTSNGSCGHLDIPTPDYDSTMEKKYKDIYNSAHSSAPSVPTPDYSTLSRKSLKQCQPDSPIYRRKSPQYLIVDYETDSLERLEETKKRKGSQSSSSPSSDVSSQLSPSLSTALPLEEELEINHTVYNKIESGFRKDNGGGDVKQKKLAMAKSSGAGGGSTKKKKDISARIKYDTPFRGSMTIEVEHEPPSDLEPSTDSEQYDPATLDRNMKQQSFCDINAWSAQMRQAVAMGQKGAESLPDLSHSHSVSQLVRASSSFRREQSERGTAYESHVELRVQQRAQEENDARPSFNSLREIYQSQLVRHNSGASSSCKCGGQARQQLQQQLEALNEQGRLLTLEAKHSRRQRLIEPPTPPPLVEITKVANNKTTIKISTPKVNRAMIPAKGPPEAVIIEPQVHHNNNYNRAKSGYANKSFNGEHQLYASSQDMHTTAWVGDGNHKRSNSSKTPLSQRKRSPPPPPPPPPPQSNSASTTLTSRASTNQRHPQHHYQNQSQYMHQSATEEETISNHSESTEVTGVSDTLANSEFDPNTLSSIMAHKHINGKVAPVHANGKLHSESPPTLKKQQKKLKGESSDYGAMFNTQINGLRNDYSLTKYLNRRKSQPHEDGKHHHDTHDKGKGGKLDETNNNNHNAKLAAENELTLGSRSSHRSNSSRLSDRTKELYRNAGVPVGIAYPQRSSAGGSGGGATVAVNSATSINNVQTVYRCEIEPLQLTHGMQIAMGLKDRAKKAKDLKNAWKKFVSMAAAKFSPTHSPAPPFDKKASPSASLIEVLDRDEGISSLIDEQAQAHMSTPPTQPPTSSYSAPASQNYYEQRFGARPAQEMDSGYMSADSGEVYKRSFYDRYNFKLTGGRNHVITVDTIEDNSDGGDGGTLTDPPDVVRHDSLLDSNRFEDLEHNMGEPLQSAEAELDAGSEAESDKTLTHNNSESRLSRHQQPDLSAYTSEEEENDRAERSSSYGSSETDGETNADDMWESGAESIETHSVLYKNVRKS